MRHQSENESSDRRRISPAAWLLSLAVHLVILLSIAMCGGLFIRGQRSAATAQPAQPVAIVWTQRPAERTDYFTDEADDKSARSQAALDLPEAALPDAASPASMPPPLIPGIELPHRTPGLESGDQPALNLDQPPAGSGPRGRPRIPGLVDEAAIRAEDAAIPREAVPTGPTVDLSLFGGPAATGRSFVFVIDRSASMGSEGLGAIQAAAEELETKLGALTSEQTFQVVAYNQAAAYFTGRELIPATTENQKKLANFVQNLAAYGETEHVRGLNAALRLKPEVIYLLTDGDPQLNALDLRTIRDQAGARTSIHCLQFGRGQPDAAQQQSFERLARENRGGYIYIDLNRR
jgi:hypothetical protein